jgi:prepilin-type processing-associated H-X9-DG protein
LGGCNYLFVDGHVKWLVAEQDGITKNAADTGTVPTEIRPDGVNFVGPRREGVSYTGIEVGTTAVYN